mgnify:CR=1 FL=1
MFVSWNCNKQEEMEGKKRKREEEPSTFETGVKKERTKSRIEEEEHCNWSSLDGEISSMILHQATHTPDLGENASALIVCRFVCRQWRNFLPRPPCHHRTSRYQTFAAHFISSVAEKGYLAIMKWARENGSPLDSTSFEKAAGGGHLEMLKWLDEQECPKDVDTAMKSAIDGGHLEVMKWLKEDAGCPLVESLSLSAAHEGQLEALKWLKENGCVVDAFCLIYAAERCDLEMLTWLNENGCPFDRKLSYLITEAAQTGNLEVMKWLKDNGCILSNTAYFRACESGPKSVEIFQWLKELDCPWNNTAYITASKIGNLEALNWLSENGNAYGMKKPVPKLPGEVILMC